MSVSTAIDFSARLYEKSVKEKMKDRKDVESPIIEKAMKDESYRKRLVEDPKTVLEQEFSLLAGKEIKFPDNFEIKVLEENVNTAYLVIPPVIKSSELPTNADIDSDGGVAYYCTTITCKPGFSC